MEKHIPFEEATNKLMCRLEEKGYSDSYIKFSQSELKVNEMNSAKDIDLVRKAQNS